MEKISEEEYNSILQFIEHINDFSSVEIFAKIKHIMDELKSSGAFYDLRKKIINLSIKSVKDLNIKVALIKEYYFLGFDDFDDNSLDYDIVCFNWDSVLISLETLNEEDKITVLRQLFLNQTFNNVSNLLNIPKDLKFGVELEYCKLSFEELKKMFNNKSIEIVMKALQIPSNISDSIVNNSGFGKGNDFSKWIFTKESSEDLPEASSPIMHNTLDCLNQINAICLLFKALCAHLHGGTGLHINVGADYFKGNLDALKYLLVIWGECEELFYKIANEENEVIRCSADTMSVPIKSNIQKTFKENPAFAIDTPEDMDNFLYNIQVRERLYNLLNQLNLYYPSSNLEKELRESQSAKEKYSIFIKYLKEKPKSDTSIRFTSINFNHMNWYGDDKGRIEFRIFNNSLDFNTITQDLLLVGKLIETSLALANSSERKQEYFRRLLNRDVSEEEKLNLLLDLLFDQEEEKEIFKKRWLSIKDNPTYKKFYTGKKTFNKLRKTPHK